MKSLMIEISSTSLLSSPSWWSVGRRWPTTHRGRQATGPFTAIFQIPQELARCDCWSLKPHLHSSHTLSSNLHWRKHQFILHKEFLLIAVNYVEMNCLIICHFHKQCHIRDSFYPWPAAQFASAEVTWGCSRVFHGWRGAPVQLSRQKDNSCCCCCAFVFLFHYFHALLFFQTSPVFRSQSGKREDIISLRKHLGHARWELHLCGCLTNMEKKEKKNSPLFTFRSRQRWCKYVVCICYFPWNR